MADTTGRKKKTPAAGKAAKAKAPATAAKANAKDKPKADPPATASDLASVLGVKLTRLMTTEQINKLRKALPGYVGLLDDAAEQLEADADLLGLPDVTPARLLAVQADQKHLAAREAVVESLYRSIYEQRLQADDAGMAMLQKLARRIEAKSEDDPDLKDRWKFLLDFLGTFRAGGRKKDADK